MVGIDEVGRGCWAGPVAVGAYVVTSDTKVIESVRDSKQLSASKREVVARELASGKHQVVYGSVEQIDSLGIAKTIEPLIAQLVDSFSEETYFLIDGNFSANFGDNSLQVKKGDSVHYSIAAASVLAKVARDGLMREMDSRYPGYGFAQHVGYGTVQHRTAIMQKGLTDHHRLSFEPMKSVAVRSV